MGRGKSWSPDVLAKVNSLLHCGIPMPKIAVQLNIKYGSLRKYHARLRRGQTTGAHQGCYKGKAKMQDLHDWVAGFIAENPRSSIRDVYNAALTAGFKGSSTTVWRAMSAGAQPFKKVRCQKVSPPNAEIRKMVPRDVVQD